jgi:hypothetical protein
MRRSEARRLDAAHASMLHPQALGADGRVTLFDEVLWRSLAVGFVNAVVAQEADGS